MSAIQKAIEASREREGAGKASDVPARELYPGWLETYEPRFREALAVAMVGLQPCVTPLPCGKYPGVSARELCRRCRYEARIERIVTGETEGA